MTSRPDIVLLVLDTQRADRLSCYGCPSETSPHLDALAAESTLFRHATSTASWTIPSHASMFTGYYPAQHNTVQSFSVLPYTMPTLAERLRASGYFTAAFCNNPLVGVINNGLRRGFQSFLNYSGWLTSRPNQVGATGSGLIDRYRQWFKRLLTAVVTRIQDAFARSELLLELSFSPLMVPFWQTALSFKGSTAKSLQDAAVLLTQRKGVAEDQPVFSFINLMGTHMPYDPPRRFVTRFAPHVRSNKAAQRYLHHFNSDIAGWYMPLAHSLDEEQKVTLDGMYNSEVAYQDELVGEFLQKLRASGRLDRTFLVVCADHGDHLGEKEFMGHSLSLYNELIHVPLLVRDPGGDFPRGKTVEQFVSTRRVFHSMLEFAGLADESERAMTLAHSVASDPDAGTVFSEGIPPQNILNVLRRREPELLRERGCDQTRRAVWGEAHKLIQTGEDRLELFSVLDDPAEQVNLCDILPEKVELLRDSLLAFVRGVSASSSAVERAEGYDDPEVRRRLRDLGYLE